MRIRDFTVIVFYFIFTTPVDHTHFVIIASKWRNDHAHLLLYTSRRTRVSVYGTSSHVLMTTTTINYYYYSILCYYVLLTVVIILLSYPLHVITTAFALRYFIRYLFQILFDVVRSLLRIPPVPPVVHYILVLPQNFSYLSISSEDIHTACIRENNSIFFFLLCYRHELQLAVDQVHHRRKMRDHQTDCRSRVRWPLSGLRLVPAVQPETEIVFGGQSTGIAVLIYNFILLTR